MTENSAIHLNHEQKKAVTHGHGPLLIIAGAGTGKTTVITERIKFLIEQGLAKPSEILALTFTERATQEMEERVDQALPMGYTQTWISTFHSFGERILRREAIHIGLSPDFTILSEAETYLFIKKHLFEFALKYFKPLGNPTKFIGELVTHFSRLKDEDVSPHQYLRWSRSPISNVQSPKLNTKVKIEKETVASQELAHAYQKYEDLKVRENVMDFADLISNTLRLFRERPNVLLRYQEQFKYILIDEFQDTNYAQNHLAILLSGDDQNITAVSDDDQAIFRWRGAAVYNVLDFKKHFPKAKIITLKENYRSQQAILDRAYQLIQHNNPHRLEIQEKINKQLQSQISKTSSDPVIQVIFKDRVEDEAETVAQEIAQLISTNPKSEIRPFDSAPIAPGRVEGFNPDPPQASQSSTQSIILHPPHPQRQQAGLRGERVPSTLQYQDIVLLVRANHYAQPFIQALNRHGIPHQFLGPGKLYQKPEIKDLIAYLTVLSNFTDDVAMYRVLVMPQLGINRRDLAALICFGKRYNLSLFETIEQARTIPGSAFVTKAKTTHNPNNNERNRPPIRQQPSISNETMRKLTKLVKIAKHHLDLIPNESPGQVLYYFVKDTGLLQRLAEPRSELEQRQALNISKFFDKIKIFETHHPEARVFDFVEYLDFVMAQGESPLASETDWSKENAVNIITVHSAKGLEFPVVFMVNLVNDRFPIRNRRNQISLPEELIHEPLPEGDLHEHEERRLFYVGMTRAKQKLYFTGAKFYGETKRPKKLSPFVYEALGEDLSIYLLQDEGKTPPTLLEWGSVRKEGGNEGKKRRVAAGQSTHKAQISTQPSTFNPLISYLSYSQINTFEICPLHYKLKYLLKIPTLPSAAVSFGRTLHETLKQFYQRIRAAGYRVDGKAPLQFLLDLYQQNWIPEGYESKQHEAEQKRQGQRYLREFLEKSFDPTILPLELEEPFNFKLDDLKIGGRIDRIDLLPKGSIEIIDYKTGQIPDKKFLAKDLQLSIYALAAQSIPSHWQRQLNQIKLSYYYFEQGEKKTPERTSQALEEAKEKILEFREKIQTSDFSCSGNLICRKGCEYALFCNTELDR